MVYIFIILCFYSVLISYYIYKDIINPSFLLSFFWMILAIFASFCFYGLYPASDKSYITCCIGVLFFTIGNLISNSFCKKKKLKFGKLNDSYVHNKHSFSKKRFRIIVIIMLLFCLVRFKTVLSMLRAGYSLDMIRLVYFGYNVGGYGFSEFMSIIELFIHLPLLYASMAIISYNLALPKREKYIDSFTQIIALIWILFAQIITGGRMTLYIFGIEIFISYLIVNHYTIVNIKEFFQNHIKLIFFILCLVMIVYQLSLGRKNTDTYDVMKALYVDFCGSFTHMGLRFKQVDFEQYTYGLSLLSGFLRPLMLVIKYTLGKFPYLYQITIDIGNILQTPIMIGTNIETNAYVFPVFYFYYDGGFIGVLIDSLICGIVSGKIYYNANKSDNLYDNAIYLLIIYGICTSFIRYSGNLVYYALAFFMMRIFFKNK